MSYEDSAGLGVKQAYGPKQAGDHIVAGGFHSENGEQTIAIQFDETMLGEGFIDVHLPDGAQVVDANLKVETAFVGAGAIVELGTDGAEVANGISWVVANIGTDNRWVAGATAAGTWANPLVGVTKVGLVESGGAFTAGAGCIYLTYKMC